MKELQEDHVAQKREVTFIGWSGDLGFCDLLSSISTPSFPPPWTDWQIFCCCYCSWLLTCINIQEVQLPRQWLPWPWIVASRPSLLNWTYPLLCGSLGRNPFGPSKEGCAINLRWIVWSFCVWTLLWNSTQERTKGLWTSVIVQVGHQCKGSDTETSEWTRSGPQGKDNSFYKSTPEEETTWRGSQLTRALKRAQRWKCLDQSPARSSHSHSSYPILFYLKHLKMGNTFIYFFLKTEEIY